MPARMVLLRHGATEWSRSGQHTGRTDIPLLERAASRPQRAGDLLRDWRLAPFAQVLTSPLSRAAETCALAGFSGEPDPDLMEWDYGDYEGLTSAEIVERRPGWTLWDEGVPEGERAADVGRRADRVIERVRAVEGTRCASPTGTCCGFWRPAGSGSRRWRPGSSSWGPAPIGVLGWERRVAGDGAWNFGPGPVGDEGRRISDGGGNGALGPVDHVGQAVGLEVQPDGLAHVGPDRQQDALPLVVAGAVGVGLAEVPAAMGPSTAETIWAKEMSSGGRARTYPPPTPRLERTRPAPLRASRICSRYGWGSPVRSAMSRTEVGVSAPWRASDSNALLA